MRTAIEHQDLWVLNEIDPQALLRRDGYAMGAARQILFFHLRFMARLLAADPAALIEAPLKFAVLELERNMVMVRWSDPVVAFARYRNPRLADLGHELATLCEKIVDMAPRCNVAHLPGSLTIDWRSPADACDL